MEVSRRIFQFLVDVKNKFLFQKLLEIDKLSFSGHLSFKEIGKTKEKTKCRMGDFLNFHLLTQIKKTVS